MTLLLGDISPVDLGADDPCFAPSSTTPAAFAACSRAPPPAWAENLIEPLADAVVDPMPPTTTVPVTVISAFHGGLLTDSRARHDVARLLAGKAISSGTALDGAEHAIRLAGGVWQAPSLPLRFYTHSDDTPSCRAMADHLRRWIDPGSGPPGPPVAAVRSWRSWTPG